MNAPISEVDIDTRVNGNGSTITANKAVYINSSGEFDLAKADGGTTAPAYGFTTASVASGASGSLQTDGLLTGFSGLTAGSKYYVDASTAGAITATAPTTAGQYVCGVGRAVSSTELQIDISDPILL